MKTDDDTFESIGTVAERVVRNTKVSAAVPRWAWHTAALHNPKAIGKTLLVHSTPEEGWFRVKGKEGPWEPVTLWVEGDQWFALRGIEPDRRTVHADDVWTWCARYPISFEEYERVAEQGHEWSDVDSVVQSQRRGPPKPGDNAGDRSESEMLADDIKAALDQLRQYKAIADDEQAGKAQSLRSRLLELHRAADKIREKLVRPHLDAQKEINGEWQPLVKDAKGGADTLRKTLEGYETKKLQARRAAEEATRRAEEDAANREAEMSFVAGEPEPEVTAPAAAPATTAAAPDQIRGAYGKAASVKAVTEVVEITDIDALFGFLKTHRELVDKMFDLAKRAHGAGHSVPGVRIEERASVR
ncbi:hypothetical protein NL532_24310 [Mesorhizobium sp. C120A]|uniref:hypothetical protein n=1 Tax=unclassified Mesorhizobium TaxID=325217 RepID=UPI0003D066E9|nr:MULTISPECIES: hypothetical protein [unclassified Mesorhizobium]ESZ60688.1 hypothetical protein X728_15270 [Mesorhizobium sp. L103C120A0]WJI43734.1 hypothetical protein NL532_24310 [Mesorhizobium sp. C120A]